MAREGQHSATLTVKGNARSASKEMQALATRQHQFERSIERTNVQLDAQARKMNRANAAGRGGAKGISQLSGALMSAGGYVAAAGAAVMVTEQLSSRLIDHANVMTDLKFDINEITAAMDNMTTGFEAARGAAALQSTSLDLNQRQMNELAKLTATVADKNKHDLVQSWEAVSKAIAKGNVDRTRALGLNTDNAKILDEVARATGRSTTQIGLAERQSIAYAEVLRALQEQAEIAGDGQDGLAFTFERLKNKSVDALDALGSRLNTLPQDIIDFGGEVHDLTENALMGMGVEAENVGEKMEMIETGAEIVGRALLAMMTFGQSEFIPFLLEWETHLQTINGLMGNMPQLRVDRAGGLGLTAGLVTAINGLGPESNQTRMMRGLSEGINDAVDGLVDLGKASAELAKTDRKRARGGKRERVAPTLRGVDSSVGVDGSGQQALLDERQDAEVEREINRERRRAEVVALRHQNNEAIVAADEAGRLRRAEIAEERARRDDQQIDAMQAQDDREQVLHERKLRREQEALDAQRAAHEANLELIEEQRQQREDMARFFVSNAADTAQASANIAFTMQDAAKAAREAGESEAEARRKALGKSLISLSRNLAGKAIAQAAEGTVGAIMFNPLAARHFAAAGVYATAAATLGGIGRGMAGGGDSGSTGTGVGRSGGGGGRRTAPRAASARSGETAVPISRASERDGDPTRQDSRGGQARGGDYIVNVQATMLTPEVVEEVTRKQRDQARAQGFRVGA